MHKEWTIVEKKDWLGNPTVKIESKRIVFDNEREEIDYKLKFAESGLRRYMEENGFTEQEIRFFDGGVERLIQECMKKMSGILRG